MAESIDNFSDLEDDSSSISEDHLISEFNRAAKHVPKIASTLSSTVLLQIYGFYKQANEGSCDIPKPSWFRAQDKAKWEAWAALKDMPQEIAMRKYINLVSEVDKNWKSTEANTDSSASSPDKEKGWVAVSTLNSIEHPPIESDKTIFDFCKEGDLDQVSNLLRDFKKDVLDESGLGLIHWAADRGFSDILKCLLVEGYNINLKDSDGQTALHYAVSCGHKDCVKFLLDNDIDRNIQDNDGLLALELTDDDVIRQLFV